MSSGISRQAWEWFNNHFLNSYGPPLRGIAVWTLVIWHLGTCSWPQAWVRTREQLQGILWWAAVFIVVWWTLMLDFGRKINELWLKIPKVNAILIQNPSNSISAAVLVGFLMIRLWKLYRYCQKLWGTRNDRKQVEDKEDLSVVFKPRPSTLNGPVISSLAANNPQLLAEQLQTLVEKTIHEQLVILREEILTVLSNKLENIKDNLVLCVSSQAESGVDNVEKSNISDNKEKINRSRLSELSVESKKIKKTENRSIIEPKVPMATTVESLIPVKIKKKENQRMKPVRKPSVRFSSHLISSTSLSSSSSSSSTSSISSTSSSSPSDSDDSKHDYEIDVRRSENECIKGMVNGKTIWPTIEESVAMPLVTKKSKLYKVQNRPQASLTPQEVEIQSLREKIRELATENQQIKANKSLLTEEEKTLNKAQLTEKWASERREQRFGPPDLEMLTEEEKQLTRQQLRRKLAEEAHQRWISRQRAMGIELVPCGDCGYLKRVNDMRHFCFRPNWKFPVTRRSGIDQHQEIVVTNSGGGVRINRQIAIDPIELDKRLAYLHDLKQKIESKQQITRPEENLRQPQSHEIIEVPDDEQLMTDDIKTMVVTQLTPPYRPTLAPIPVRNRFQHLFQEELEEIAGR